MFKNKYIILAVFIFACTIFTLENSNANFKFVKGDSNSILKISNDSFNGNIDGLINEFNDSGDLVRSTVYQNSKVLTYREFGGPPKLKIEKIPGLVKNYYDDSLPPYGTFLKNWSRKSINNLRTLFYNSLAEDNLCKFYGEKKAFSVSGNICNKSQHKKFNKFFITQIPWLKNAQFAYLKKNINKIPTLFIIVSTGNEYDNYVGIYQVSFLNEDREKFYFYGPYLNGSFQAIKKLDDSDAMFIRYQSCTECHPWIYMGIIRFDQANQNSGTPIHFKYTNSPVSRLEHKLPGYGHSMEGTVETRIPKVGPFSIIQNFILENNQVEWWGFNCSQILCSSKLVKGDLPLEFTDGWETGYKLY
jgi:hypothetical protein